MIFAKYIVMPKRRITESAKKSASKSATIKSHKRPRTKKSLPISPIKSLEQPSKQPDSPTPSPSKSPDFVSRLMDNLRSVFSDLSFEVITGLHDKTQNLNYDEIRGFICDSKETCECFALKVYYDAEPYVLIDRIKYKYGTDCKLTGTNIITRLTGMFRDNHISPVQLYDAAKIHIVVDGKPHALKLSTYHILLHGVSWYNKYGYLTDMHSREVENNERVANTILPPKVRKEATKALGDSIPETTTFREFTRMVDNARLGKSGSEEDKNRFMRAYLVVEDYLENSKSNKNMKIKYDFSGLKLREV
jgi:hypothetical protein